MPYFTRSWPAMIHLGDCGIVPAATYDIYVTCDGIVLGEPLTVSTTAEPTPWYWGDCVGAFDGLGWSAPDGVVNFNDVQAIVQKFVMAPTAPHFTWVDVEGEVPNEVINFSDVFRVVLAFQGAEYPFAAPADCP